MIMFNDYSYHPSIHELRIFVVDTFVGVMVGIPRVLIGGALCAVRTGSVTSDHAALQCDLPSGAWARAAAALQLCFACCLL
jgi:hypothetical protein